MRFYEILLEISDKIKTQMREKFKQEDSSLNDQQIDFYLNKWDNFSKSFPVDQRDITRLSFKQVEQLVDAAIAKQNLRGKKTPKPTNNTGVMPGHIYNKNNLVIYKGDSKAKCIQYGVGYTWCISRSDASNLYNRYRFSGIEPVFYYVFDKDKPKADSWHAVVIYVTKDNKYMVATSVNSGDEKMSWESISQKLPKLAKLQPLFKPQPPSEQEKADFKKYGQWVNDATYDQFTLAEKIKYIEFGNKISKTQQAELPDQLLSLYSKHNPTNLSQESWVRLNLSDFKYAFSQAMQMTVEWHETKLPDIRRGLSDQKKNVVINLVSSKPEYAFLYARDVIKGRWPAGEPAIASSHSTAARYARYVIKGRWPAGEKAIASDPDNAYYYARDVIKGRWPAGEPAIANSPERARKYAEEFNLTYDEKNRLFIEN